MKILKVSGIVSLCSLMLWGCGQANIKRQGTSFLEQGRYEQAVNAYKQVVASKPKDEESRLKLTVAQQGLDKWVIQVGQSANTYYKNGAFGKAMFLYGKIVQINNDPLAVERYKASLSALKNQYELHAKIDFPRSVFGTDFGADIEGLILIQQASKNSPNFWHISFDREAIQVKQSFEEVQEFAQYIVDYETIANPEHAEALATIDSQEALIERAQQSLDTKLRRELDLRRSLSDATKDLEHYELKLNYETAGTAQYNAIDQQVKHKASKVARIKKDIRRVESDVRSVEKKLLSERNEKYRLTDQLRNIPPTAQRAIYADYHYSRFVERQVAATQLLIQKNGRMEKYYLESIFEDDRYEAHVKINLPAKRASLKSQGEFESILNAQSRVQAEQYLKAEVYDYKKQFLRKSKQASDPNKSFELLAVHSLAGADGVSEAVALMMRSKLEAEFGVGAVFNVNQLVNLF